MSRPSLAIVGTGIAGLGCAHFLQRRFDLTLFDPNTHIGGHSNTVLVDEPGGQVPVDTGFMVFNRVTYPNLIRLFDELGVATQRTDMSFSVQHVPTGLEFCGSGWNELFAQRRNVFRPRFWNLLRQIHRFNSEAARALAQPLDARVTLADYVAHRRYGSDFLDHYLVPMSSAVWSTPPDRMLLFPALTLLRFFHNHGFLGLHTQHPWWTVTGGARAYVEKLVAPFRDRVRLRCGISSVRRQSKGVIVTTADGVQHAFDRVILACHADHTLELLKDATPLERTVLGEFKYQPNAAWLHTDESVMPRNRRAWASWNYRSETDRSGVFRHQTIYWMNRLQRVSERTNYFVSINGQHAVDPGKVLRKIDYEHPLFTVGAVDAQAQLPGLNSQSPDQAVFFCGSYFRYGFHEDAFTSAVDVSQTILGGSPWREG